MAHSPQGPPARREKMADHDRACLKSDFGLDCDWNCHTVTSPGRAPLQPQKRGCHYFLPAARCFRRTLRQHRGAIQSSHISLLSQLGAARGAKTASFVTAARRQRRRGPFNLSANSALQQGGSVVHLVGTPFGFSAAPTRRMPCLPLSSRATGEKTNHCPVASQATAKTATSGGSSIIKHQIAKLRVKFQQARRSTRGLPAKLRLRFYGKACRSAFSRISPSAFAAAQVGPTPGMARNRVGPFGSTSRKASTMTSASREPT